MKPLSFQQRYGPWALVAGASQGIGAEFATQLAARGLNIVAVARNADRLYTLTNQLTLTSHVQALPIVSDLSQPDAITQIVASIAHLDISLLVYNAAYSVIGPFMLRSADEHILEIDTNVRAPMLLAHHFGNLMASRRRGGIILMSSMSAIQGSALIANYSATKAYNQILAEGLWEELREQGVDVLASCAGAVKTPNYVQSRRDQPNSIKAPLITPDVVVRDTLAMLGQQPNVVPGRTNRLLSFVMQHLFSRRMAISIMGRTMRQLYSREVDMTS